MSVTIFLGWPSRNIRKNCLMFTANLVFHAIFSILTVRSHIGQCVKMRELILCASFKIYNLMNSITQLVKKIY